jgi:carbamate kinase
MGYMIQQSLANALTRAGSDRRVVTVITQTLCDGDDPALTRPTKPIGHPLDQTRLARLRAAGEAVTEERPGRWRRIAPSPQPRAIVEQDLVRDLVQSGVIVVACGGGGPPVYRHPQLGLEGMMRWRQGRRRMTRGIRADTLLILTAVDAVYAAFGTARARALPSLSLAEAAALLDGTDLGVGSMRPKVEAAVAFVRGGGRRAIIAELAQGLAALRGETGTTIMGEQA